MESVEDQMKFISPSYKIVEEASKTSDADGESNDLELSVKFNVQPIKIVFQKRAV
jgi:hypothetical protein